MSNIDSKFDWFVDKFSFTSARLNSDENGFIKALEFRRSGRKDINSNSYRQLMKMAVDRGYATDNGMNPTHSKYAIRFNSSPTRTRLFDRELLEDYLFFYGLVTSIVRPQNFCHGYVDDWKLHTLYWLSILRAFIIYEDTGEIETDFLSKSLNKESFNLMVVKLIHAYKILKYGWSNIQLSDPLKHQNYNDCFKSILKCFCEIYWNARHENSINRPQTQRKALDNIKNTVVNEKDVDRLKHDLDWNRDDIAGRYAALNWLKKAVEQSQDLHVKSALQQLESIQKEQAEAVYTKVRRQEKKGNK
jgi:hypothetical protein